MDDPMAATLWPNSGIRDGESPLTKGSTDLLYQKSSLQMWSDGEAIECSSGDASLCSYKASAWCGP
jgi:hypothetical protein